MCRGRKTRALGTVLAGCLTLAAASALAQGASSYVLVPEESSVRIHVGKTGVFNAFGHEHNVVAPALSGEVVLPEGGLAGTQVSVTFESGALRVDPQGEPEGDAPKVQAAMRGPEVLDAARFPRITFHSEHFTVQKTGPTEVDGEVTGTLELHGVSRPVRVPVQVRLAPGALLATGKTVLKQTDFGISPVSAGGGTVKVEDEVTIAFRLVGRPSR
jgi:polyisoprenoid-binding protein YceI